MNRPDEAAAKQEALARLDRVVEQLKQDGRPFQELSPEERRERLDLLRGVGKGLGSTVEEFCRWRQEERELEERKLARR